MKLATAITALTLIAAPAAADVWYPVDELAAGTGEDITQVIRVSGIDTLVNSVTLISYGDIWYGIDWIEDWGDGPLIWGNEYMDYQDFTLMVGQSYDYTSTLIGMFNYRITARLDQDGDDLLAVLRFRVGNFQSTCVVGVTPEYQDCGIRPFGGYFYSDIIVSGPGEYDAIVSNLVRPTVPEPATWGMMIAGFGLVGGMLRRRAPAIA